MPPAKGEDYVRQGPIDAVYALAPALPRPPSIDCECSLLGSEMPHNALPAVPAPSERAMSPSDKIPTRRFSWFSTGSRRAAMAWRIEGLVVGPDFARIEFVVDADVQDVVGDCEG